MCLVPSEPPTYRLEASRDSQIVRPPPSKVWLPYGESVSRVKGPLYLLDDVAVEALCNDEVAFSLIVRCSVVRTHLLVKRPVARQEDGHTSDKGMGNPDGHLIPRSAIIRGRVSAILILLVRDLITEDNRPQLTKSYTDRNSGSFDGCIHSRAAIWYKARLIEAGELEKDHLGRFRRVSSGEPFTGLTGTPEVSKYVCR